MKEEPKIIPCPICRKEGPWFTFSHGPFCSPRCKTIDLGKWLGEEYRFSEPLDDQDLEDPLFEKDTDQDSEPF